MHHRKNGSWKWNPLWKIEMIWGITFLTRISGQMTLFLSSGWIITCQNNFPKISTYSRSKSDSMIQPEFHSKMAAQPLFKVQITIPWTGTLRRIIGETHLGRWYRRWNEGSGVNLYKCNVKRPVAIYLFDMLDRYRGGKLFIFYCKFGVCFVEIVHRQPCQKKRFPELMSGSKSQGTPKFMPRSSKGWVPRVMTLWR